ncbi:mediator of RNA polymerase II transcription subunit 31-like isoform X3 [Artemia franciscana]|uniref:mediator of RNA polymerase II transcription subunit 31-like isoform X3 n=1 Tax=Artemia franciscana TaxID=6661 RepID=UPI0032DA8947
MDIGQQGYLKDPAFVNYLKYLQYWKEPHYAKFLKYPMCLSLLDLLQHESFRKQIVHAHQAKFIDDQQVLLWQHYTRRRTRLLQAQQEKTIQNLGERQPQQEGETSSSQMNGVLKPSQ